MQPATAFLLGAGTSALLYYAGTRQTISAPAADIGDRLRQMRAQLAGAVDRQRADWERRLANEPTESQGNAKEKSDYWLRMETDRVVSGWNRLVAGGVGQIQRWRPGDQVLAWIDRLQQQTASESESTAASHTEIAKKDKQG